MLRKRFFLFSVAVVCLVVAVSFLYIANQNPYSEVQELDTLVLTEDGYTHYFSELAKEKGSLYAFELLRRVNLPSGINIHSVAHGIGYVLFDEKGVSGIYDCTDEFRSACSHAIVIQALSEGGSSAIQKIIETCQSAPGGRGAYAICFHGVGHGFVASDGYDFKSAAVQCVEISANTNTAPVGHRFMNASEECIGGAVMEMVQGEHDRDAWRKTVSTYLPIDNPFRPCVDNYIPTRLRSACLVSLTQRFFGAAGVSEDIPLPDTYAEAMAVCATASTEDDRTACYGGFGKEFVFYSTQFDGREVTNLSDTALMNIRDWCGYAKDLKGVARCVSVAVDTLFWAGQNEPYSAIRFCSLVSDLNREACYAGLIENIQYFLEKTEKRDLACRALPQEFQEKCMSVSRFLFMPSGFGTMQV